MDRVKVTYAGKRSSRLKYMIKPGGKTYTASGYKFGLSGSVNLLLPEEAAVLADLDGDSGVTKVVGRNEVKLKNRDLVTVGAGLPLPDGDTFDVDGAKRKKSSTAKTEG